MISTTSKFRSNSHAILTRAKRASEDRIREQEKLSLMLERENMGFGMDLPKNGIFPTGDAWEKLLLAGKETK